ncbi:peroxiredoxin family protein [Fodinicola feengrottensis]|uniref:peroxiredoxin family protein n=1 Tax=Fodinicola feengrottensis TaxID=435914 RepID=UPI0031E3A1C4
MDTRLPEIRMSDTEGKAVRLTDFPGQAVLMFFMRSTTCPVCNLHVRHLVSRSAEFRAHGVQVIIAVPEDRVDAARWKEKQSIPFPVISNSTGGPHTGVGLTKKVFGMMQQSGTLLIDRSGVIRYAHSATMPTGSYNRKAVQAAIAELSP